MKKTAIVSIEKMVLSCVIFIILFGIGGFPVLSTSEAAQGRTIDETYLISLPMPGGAKDSTIVLASDGEKITGTMSAPGNPSEVSSIQDGRYVEGKLTFSAEIGRITYVMEGSYEGDKLVFDMTTLETIPLDDGVRLSGKTGEITGTYKVPVYSPGGVKENQVELVAEKGIITGEMYSTGESGGAPEGMGGFPEGMGGAPEGMGSPPEGMGGAPGNMGSPQEGGFPGGGDAPAGITASSDGKRDLNTFYDGTYEGNKISLFTKTAQGSVFHFTGTVDGNTIKLTMHVTDKNSGIEAKKK